MKKVLQGATAIAAVMIAAPSAMAAEGWYGRADAGYTVDGEAKLDKSPGFGGTGTLSNEWTQHLGLGYKFGNGFRLETELGHRWNAIDATPATTTSGIRDGSDTHVWTGLLNGLYDFNKAGRVHPYVGVGVGLARADLSAASPVPGTLVNDSDTALAYQGLVGLAFDVTERLALDIGYRYLKASDLEFVRTTGA
ncbi:MAG: porin family protein, partial [Alphaproteobacteria bacterium]|nr:porin family protein [Alphaproteobacteria bacterium]